VKIRARITLWITVAGLSVSLLFSAFIYWEMREQAFRTLDSELKATIRNVFEIIRRGEQEQAPFTCPAAEVFFASRRFWIKAWRGRDLIYTSRLADQVALPAIQRKKETISRTIPKSRLDLHQDRFNEVTFRIRRALIPATGTTPGYRIQVALPMEKLDEELNEVLFVIGLGLPGAALLLAFLAWFLAGRILGPIREMTARAQEIDEQGLADRIPAADNRDEFSELGRALNQMLDRLQHSFNRQKEFVAAAAHELKTPLTNLRLFIEQTQADPGLDAAFRRRLARQQEILLRLGRLLNNLMLLSALEMKPVLQCEEFDFRELIETVLEDFTPLLAAEKIAVDYSPPPGEIRLQGDPARLRRMLVNLLENAIKYNLPAGRLRLELAQEEGWLILKIANLVPEPLPETELEQLFEQFYRREKSRSSEYGGCGLGLTIVREIVHLHGGRVSLRNLTENWFEVTVRLPVQSSFPPASPGRAAASQAGAGGESENQ